MENAQEKDGKRISSVTLLAENIPIYERKEKFLKKISLFSSEKFTVWTSIFLTLSGTILLCILEPRFFPGVLFLLVIFGLLVVGLMSLVIEYVGKAFKWIFTVLLMPERFKFSPLAIINPKKKNERALQYSLYQKFKESPPETPRITSEESSAPGISGTNSNSHPVEYKDLTIHSSGNLGIQARPLSEKLQIGEKKDGTSHFGREDFENSIRKIRSAHEASKDRPNLIEDVWKKRRDVGEKGEIFCLRYEKDRLLELGIIHPQYPVHVSKEWKEMPGFDILSLDHQQKRIFLEVKTTVAPYNSSFILSENEYGTMNRNPESYRVYRVYNFDTQTMTGDIKVLKLEDISEFSIKPYDFKFEIK